MFCDSDQGSRHKLQQRDVRCSDSGRDTGEQTTLTCNWCASNAASVSGNVHGGLSRRQRDGRVDVRGERSVHEHRRWSFNHDELGTGTCSVTATKAADTNYNSATSGASTVAATLANQAALTVTGVPVTPQAYQATFTVGSAGRQRDGRVDVRGERSVPRTPPVEL